MFFDCLAILDNSGNTVVKYSYNAVSIRRHNMYLNKFRGLTGELIFCGINYASSTIISDVVSGHISNNMESFLYGF